MCTWLNTLFITYTVHVFCFNLSLSLSVFGVVGSYVNSIGQWFWYLALCIFGIWRWQFGFFS
jgi:hypothetical protein